MQVYTNQVTGTRIEVVQTGKSFKTRTTYPATKNTQEETVEKRHATWSGVEKLLARRGVQV